MKFIVSLLILLPAQIASYFSWAGPLIMRLIVGYYRLMQKAVDEGIPLQKIVDLPVKTEISRMRLQTADKFDDFTRVIGQRMETEFQQLTRK